MKLFIAVAELSPSLQTIFRPVMKEVDGNIYGVGRMITMLIKFVEKCSICRLLGNDK